MNEKFNKIQADYWNKKRPEGNPMGMPEPVKPPKPAPKPAAKPAAKPADAQAKAPAAENQRKQPLLPLKSQQKPQNLQRLRLKNQ